MSTVKRFVHAQHVGYVKSTAGQAAWIRTRKITMERDMFDTESAGFADGFVDLVVSACGIECPGYPAMLGLAVRAVDVPGSKELTMDVWYYSAFEVGPSLAHVAMAGQKFIPEESVVIPPSWIGLPEPQDEDEDGEEQMGPDASGEEESRETETIGSDESAVTLKRE